MANPPDNSQETKCHKCNQIFNNYAAFHQHKALSPRHLTCELCSADFKSQEGYLRHHKMAHAAKQDLPCPGCAKSFTRMGSLMGHFESGECKAAQAEYNQRKVSNESDKVMEKLRGRDLKAGWGPATEPEILAEPTNDDATSYEEFLVKGLPTIQSRPELVRLMEEKVHCDAQDTFHHEYVDVAAALLGEDEDLISFELNQPWIQDAVCGTPTRDSQTVNIDSAIEFPALGGPAVQNPRPRSRNNMDEEERLYRDESHRLTNHPADAMRAHWATSGSRLIVSTSHHLTNLTENIPFGHVAATPNASKPFLAKPSKLQPFSTYVSEAAGVSSNQPAGAPHLSEVPAKRPAKTDVIAKRLVANVLGQPAPAAWANPKSHQRVPQARTPPDRFVWGSHKNLFPDAPPVTAPTVAMLHDLSLKSPIADVSPEGTKFAQHDPENPEFNLSNYWVPFTGKYKCPHMGCIKSFPGSAGFKQHLQSPTHKADNEKYQCIHCLRYYPNQTALTQHAEAQGVRCRVRDVEGYDGYVDDLTAKTAVVAGKHGDDTVKYVINPLVDPSSAAKMALDFNIARHKAQEQSKASFWESNTPKW